MDHRKNTKRLILFTVALVAGAWGCRKRPVAERGLNELGISVTVPDGWDEERGSLPFWIEARESEGASFPMITVDEEKNLPDLAVAAGYLDDDRRVYGGSPGFTASPVSASMVSGAEAWSYSVTFLDKSKRGTAIAKDYPGPVDVPMKRTAIFLRGPRKSLRIVYSAPLSLYDKYKPAFDGWLLSVKFTP